MKIHIIISAFLIIPITSLAMDKGKTKTSDDDSLQPVNIKVDIVQEERKPVRSTKHSSAPTEEHIFSGTPHTTYHNQGTIASSFKAAVEKVTGRSRSSSITPSKIVASQSFPPAPSDIPLKQADIETSAAKNISIYNPQKTVQFAPEAQLAGAPKKEKIKRRKKEEPVLPPADNIAGDDVVQELTTQQPSEAAPTKRSGIEITDEPNSSPLPATTPLVNKQDTETVPADQLQELRAFITQALNDIATRPNTAQQQAELLAALDAIRQQLNRAPTISANDVTRLHAALAALEGRAANIENATQQMRNAQAAHQASMFMNSLMTVSAGACVASVVSWIIYRMYTKKLDTEKQSTKKVALAA